MKWLSVVLAVAVALSFSTSSSAAKGAKKPQRSRASPRRRPSKERFQRLDKDKDGKVTLPEFMGRATKEETKKQRDAVRQVQQERRSGRLPWTNSRRPISKPARRSPRSRRRRALRRRK